MGTALYSIDIVDVRINLLAITRVVLESDVNRDDLVGRYAYRIRNECLGSGIEVIYKLAEAFFGIETVGTVNLPAGSL